MRNMNVLDLSYKYKAVKRGWKCITCGHFIKTIKLVILLVLFTNVSPFWANVPLKFAALFIHIAYIESS